MRIVHCAGVARRRPEEIPIEGRIAAVADVYDALTSDRPYRPAFCEDEALQMIRDDTGLDRSIVAALEGLCAKNL